MYKNKAINIPLLASILRITDELDLPFERAPQIIFEHKPPIDPISKEEWEKHLSISGVGLSPEDSTTITCSATCKNPNIHRALKTLETKINRELEDFPNHLHQYREYIKELPRKFDIEIDSIGYKAYDYKFSLQEKEIVNLLMGKKLYKRKEESLRELLKNAVDGCRLRKALLKKRGLDYEPKITFEFSTEKVKIIVSDNGFGMDEDIVDRYFTKIGKSFYTSSEFLDQNIDISPVSELGIGILSCFMIADKIVVETKTDRSASLIIEIDNVSDYFFVKEGHRIDTGTTVYLFLKKQLFKKKMLKIGDWNTQEIDLLKEIRYYARHLDFPIYISESDNKVQKIEDSGYNPNKKCSFSRYHYTDQKSFFEKNYGFKTIKIDRDEAEGTISLFLAKHNKLGLIPKVLHWSENVYPKNKLENKLISYEGIFIGHIEILPDWLNNEDIYFDLNLKRKAIDLNAARNDIIDNNKFKNIKSIIEKELIKSLCSYLDTLKKKAKKQNINYYELFDIFFQKHINLHINKDKITCGSENNLLKLFHLKCILKEDMFYIRLDKILSGYKSISILTNCPMEDEKHLLEIFMKCPGFEKNKLYILIPEYYMYNSFVGSFLQHFPSFNFFYLLVMEKSSSLRGFIPKSWKLVKFKNYNSNRLIELSPPYGDTILNIDNKFIDLLIKGKSFLIGEKKIAVEGFFRSLKIDIKRDFKIVLDKQLAILNLFINEGLITEGKKHEYILNESDFPNNLISGK